LYEMEQAAEEQPKEAAQEEKSWDSAKRRRSRPAVQPLCQRVNWYWASWSVSCPALSSRRRVDDWYAPQPTLYAKETSASNWFCVTLAVVAFCTQLTKPETSESSTSRPWASVRVPEQAPE
jgi:hypothetical protein